jgi:hypothetical protein
MSAAAQDVEPPSCSAWGATSRLPVVPATTTAFAGPGDGTVDGDPGSDTLRGSFGSDRISGGTGNDFSDGDNPSLPLPTPTLVATTSAP